MNYKDININELIEKFNTIKKMGWIKQEQKDTGYIGIKLEKLLNLQNNNFEIPDFQGIEIKTKQDNCQNDYFTLFNATPYGQDFFEIKRIVNKFGYPDKDLKDKKVFNGDIIGNIVNKIGKNHYFSLKIDKLVMRIILVIYDYQFNVIDTNSYWDFKSLKEKLERKITYLALFRVKRIYMHGVPYFKYSNMEIYKLKSFSTFIDLLEKGKIKIQFKIGRFKKGKRIGEIHDRGTGFQIKTSDLIELYELIYHI